MELWLKEISIKELEQMFQNLENVKQQIMGLEASVERGMLVHWTLNNWIRCFRKCYEEKKKAKIVQTTLDKYFYRKYNNIRYSLVL